MEDMTRWLEQLHIHTWKLLNTTQVQSQSDLLAPRKWQNDDILFYCILHSVTTFGESGLYSVKQWVPAEMLSTQFQASDYEQRRITGNALSAEQNTGSLCPSVGRAEESSVLYIYVSLCCCFFQAGLLPNPVLKLPTSLYRFSSWSRILPHLYWQELLPH